METFAEIFESHTGRPTYKWRHYFDAYQDQLSKYRGRPVKMLEIGIARGGSLQLFRRFLGKDALITGIDINPNCKNYEEDGIRIEVGSQADETFLAEILEKHGPFDIILDDGSHQVDDQITTLNLLWPSLADGGIYCVEDCHTSYFTFFGGGYRVEKSFVEYAKTRIDTQNMWWSGRMQEADAGPWASCLPSMAFYPAMVFFHKRSYEGVEVVTNEFGELKSSSRQSLRFGTPTDRVK